MKANWWNGAKLTLLYGMLFALMVGAKTLRQMSAMPTPGDQFRQTQCDVRGPDGASLRFEHKGDAPRTIEFLPNEGKADVYLGRGPHHNVTFERIVVIHVDGYDGDEDIALLSIEFMPEERVKPSPFSVGLIDRSCLSAIKQSYGREIAFVDHR